MRFIKKISAKLPAVRSDFLIFGAALYFATVLNSTLWIRFFSVAGLNGAGDIVFAFSVPLIVFAVLYTFFALVLIPYLAKPLLVFLMLTSAACSYFMNEFGVIIDSPMVRNVFETHPAEAGNLITFKLVLTVFLLGGIASVYVCLSKINYRPFGKEIVFRAVAVGICILVIAVVAGCQHKKISRFTKTNKTVHRLVNPFNHINGTIKYVRDELGIGNSIDKLDPNAKRAVSPGRKPVVFVMFVGESARGDRFSLNGYPRITNPEMAKEGVISFRKTYSCGTMTTISVPCMFSKFPRKHYAHSKAKNTENVLDLFKQTGFDVIWRDNDNGCKGVCDRVKSENLVKAKHKEHCRGSMCYDEILTHDLEGILSGVKKDTVIVLHMLGSHYVYQKMYPPSFRHFTPTCESADVKSCPKESLDNAYDNTVFYSDYVIASTIRKLKKYSQFETAVMFVGDHGESLGENGIYMHSMPYDVAPEEQKRVPMMMWVSDGFRQSSKIDFACVKQQADTGTFSHDNLFHSLISLMGIETKVYDRGLDMFDKCRKERPGPH